MGEQLAPQLLPHWARAPGVELLCPGNNYNLLVPALPLHCVWSPKAYRVWGVISPSAASPIQTVLATHQPH